MCGILATVGVDPTIMHARGEQALRSIAHRGPDDQGTWSDNRAWLGTRRLSIIDLTPRGHQPMVHQPSGVVITFNGEIYNYLELRSELESAGHRFESRCDTEVLLAAYLAWGEACLGRLNGMWSFLLWDPSANKAFFARDRLGVKPFYFARARGGLSVASEPKALLIMHPELRRPDGAALYGFLAEGRLYTGKHSFYAGIEVLEPGHFGTFVPGASAPEIRQYWSLPPATRHPPTYRAAVQSFGDLLTDAVRLRMRSDVPVGFTLSGGLDSSALLQAATATTAASGGRLRAFTSVYSHPSGRVVDERRWARHVAGKYDRVDLEEVPAEAGEWVDQLERIAWHMDGPGYSPAVFPLWKIMERARATGTPVLLEGQGADELLGGYPQYAAVALWETLASGRPSTAIAELGSYARTFSIQSLALWLVKERASFATRVYRERVGVLGTLKPEFVRAYDSGPAVEPQRTVNGRLAADLTRDILPGLLQYGDAISMAHSVESRLPFLDYRLVEFASSLPGEFKVGGGATKRILRDHLRTVGLPTIASRRVKQGYPTPADDWLRDNGGCILRELLLSPSAEIRAYCMPKQLERLIDHHVSGRAGAGNHLYRLLTTELWLRTCITRGET